MFLGYSFGLPVIASDVGSLREEIIEGKTGFVFRPCDSSDLARSPASTSKSELYRNLEARRRRSKLTPTMDIRGVKWPQSQRRFTQICCGAERTEVAEEGRAIEGMRVAYIAPNEEQP